MATEFTLRTIEKRDNPAVAEIIRTVMGEFGATVFVARPQTPTLPLAIYRYLTHPGAMNYGQAMAMCCILMVTTAIGFVLLEKIKAIPGDY